MKRSTMFPGIEKVLHGGDYNPEQWLDRPDILEEDLRLMKKAGVNVVSLGMFSWSTYEPVEGEFHLEWLKDIMDNLHENGISVVLGTPSGARPAWLDEKYPEAMRVARNGVRNHHGVRHNHCMSSPKYREKIAIINEKLAQEFGDHPALILWHISNEYGGECWCDICARRFQDFLRERYNNDIDELNHEWWTTFWSHRYNNFEQVEPPYQNGETSIHGLNLDWKRFTTWSMTDFMNHEISSLKKHSTDIPVTSNFMRLYQGLDYHEMAKDVDIISWDIYPAWNNDYESVYQTAIGTAFEHTVMRSFKKDKPFILMESVTSQVNWHPFNKLKRPGIHKLSCMQAVACGADMIGYFQWRKGRGSYEQHHGAILDHLGTDDTRVFKDVVEVSDILEKLAPVQGSGVKTQAALIYDWNNRWAVEDMAGLSKNKNYEETCKRQHAIFQKNGIDMDIISQDADLSGYKLIVLPMLYLIKPTFADRLKDFVAKGGVVVSTYLLGYVNENTLCYLGGFPGDGLKDVFGLYTEEIDSLYPSESNGVSFKNTISDDLYTIKDYCEIVKPTGADVIGTYTKDFYAGTPVVTVNTYGEGEAYYVGARIEDDGMEAIYQKAWKAAGLNVRPLPEGVEYHVRTCEGIDYEFYLNFTDKVQTITNVADGMNLLTDEKVVDEVSIQPYHLAVLEIKK